jgi:hypothetical protein
MLSGVVNALPCQLSPVNTSLWASSRNPGLLKPSADDVFRIGSVDTSQRYNYRIKHINQVSQERGMPDSRPIGSNQLWILLGVLLIDIQLFMYAGQNYSAPLAQPISVLTIIVFVVVAIRFGVELYDIALDPQ